MDALATINIETRRAFDWLVDGIDRRLPVTFVPNPGNIGDAAINLVCFDYLKERFDTVSICTINGTPHTECVFIGGGGNAVEPLYFNVRDLLDRLPPSHRVFMFPATIRGYSKTLRRVSPFARILCRESISLAHVAKQIGPQNVMLAHDAAFLLAPRLRHDFARRMEKSPPAKCRSFRTDLESNHSQFGGNDIMLEEGTWMFGQDATADMAVARVCIWDTARYLLDFGEVETDRLHCAILAAILERRTLLRANSYYKNAAVFDHSLSRLANTTFLPSDTQPVETPHRDIKATGYHKLRSIRRRLHRFGLKARRHWSLRHE